MLSMPFIPDICRQSRPETNREQLHEEERFETFICIDRKREIAPLTPNCRTEGLGRRLAWGTELSTAILACVPAAHGQVSDA